MKKTITHTLLFLASSILIGCGGGSSSEMDTTVLNEENYLDAIDLINTINQKAEDYIYIVLGTPLDAILDYSCESGNISAEGDTFTFDLCLYNGMLINGSLDLVTYNDTTREIKNINLDLQATGWGIEHYIHYENVQVKYTRNTEDHTYSFSAYIPAGYIQEQNRTIVRYLNFGIKTENDIDYTYSKRYFGNFIAYKFSEEWIAVDTPITIKQYIGEFCPTEGTLRLRSNGSSLSLWYREDYSIDIDLNGEMQPPLTDCTEIGIYSL